MSDTPHSALGDGNGKTGDGLGAFRHMIGHDSPAVMVKTGGFSSPRYSPHRRFGAERSVIQIDVDEPTQDQRGNPRHWFRFVEGVEAFRERQRTMLIESGQEP